MGILLRLVGHLTEAEGILADRLEDQSFLFKLLVAEIPSALIKVSLMVKGLRNPSIDPCCL